MEASGDLPLPEVWRSLSVSIRDANEVYFVQKQVLGPAMTTARLTFGGFLLLALVLGVGVMTLAPPLLTEAQEPVTPGTYAARSVATDPTNPGRVYVGLQENVNGNSGGLGIWRSDNYGAAGSFSRVDQSVQGCGGGQFGGLQTSITVDPVNGDVYTVNNYGCQQGVFRSSDGGVTWVNLYQGDIQNTDIDPADHTHLLASYRSRHDICNDPCDTYVVESVDGGVTWRQSSIIVGGGWSHNIFFITSDIWLDNTRTNRGLFRTTDRGATWTKVYDTSTVENAQLVRVGNAIYTGVTGGLLRSTNNGATWTKVLDAAMGAESFMGIAADATGRLYSHSSYPFGGFGGGAFKTSTDGVTWTNESAMTFSNGPAQMASDGQYVYAAMWNLGIWRLPLSAPSGTPTSSPTATPTRTPTQTAIPATSTPTPTGTPSPVCHEAYYRDGVLTQGPVRVCP
jgi:hypothetical protein